MPYHGSMREGHSLSRSRAVLSSLKHSTSERGVSFPTSPLIGGGSTVVSFPLRQEEPSLFASDIKRRWVMCVGYRRRNEAKNEERKEKLRKEGSVVKKNERD